MTPKRCENIASLLRVQPYIESVEFSTSRHHHNLNDFRRHLRKWPGETLAEAHLFAMNCSALEKNKPWITVEPVKPTHPVVIARSPRYHNPAMDWVRVINTYRGQCCFIGTQEEHAAFDKEFGPIPHIATSNLLEVAQYIAGSELFIGNQSCPLNIAQALHHPLVMEVSPNDDNCAYERMGAIYARSSFCQLPEIKTMPVIEAPVVATAKNDLKTLIPTRTIVHPKLDAFPQIAFLSMVEGVGCYHSAYREFTPKRSDKESQVRYQQYDLDFNPVGDSKLLHRRGEDPRAFKFGGKYYCSLIEFNVRDWQQYVVDLMTGEKFKIKHPFGYAGKNWVPAVGDNRLLFVRSIEPLCVVEINSSWAANVLIQPRNPSDIGEYRGGGAATLSGNIISGVGHRTILKPRLKHVPFTYKINLDTHEVVKEDLGIEAFGFDRVIDPTSVVGNEIICSCAKSSWWDDQNITTKICEIS